MAEATPEVFAAVGIHPNDALTFEAGTIGELRKLLASPKVRAVGEIGLDYYRDRAPKDIQMVVFRQQLALAEEAGLPVIIHNRNASSDLLEVLEDWHAELVKSNPILAENPGVLHSFSASPEIAQRAMAINFFIGITGPVTFKNAPELQELVSTLPLDCLLIETDAPFLTPHPHRGKRNEPADVRYTAEKIASLKNLPFAMVAETTTQNAGRLFHW